MDSYSVTVKIDLTPEQAEILKKFKEKVTDVVDTLHKREYLKDILKPEVVDAFLLRWLRARKFDLQKAELMLRNNVVWREKYGADTILDGNYTVPDIIRKYFTGGICGYDKEGYPVYFECIGKSDPKGLLLSIKKSDIMKYKVYQCETLADLMLKESLERKRLIEKFVIVFDMEGVGLRHLWRPAIGLFTDIIKRLDENYPEGLKIAFVINAPALFPLCWKLTRPFLAEETANKIEVLGSNYQEVLLKNIDSVELPMCYGGQRVDADGDPRCADQICQGGMIPTECYSQMNVGRDDMTSVTVKNRASLELEFEIKKPNTVMRWEFVTEGYDIGFGVYKRTAPKKQTPAEMKVLVENQKITSHLYPEDGNVMCETPGTYVLIFDNTYSIARNKNLHYIVGIVEPDE